MNVCLEGSNPSFSVTGEPCFGGALDLYWRIESASADARGYNAVVAGELRTARANTATLVEKCESLLELLRAYPDWPSLRRMTADVESLRDELRAELAVIEAAVEP